MDKLVETARPKFVDYDEVYFADACEPLEEAVRQNAVVLQALTHGAYPGRALGDGIVEGVRTVGFWDVSRPQNWGLAWHRNEGIEITYLDRGSAAFATRDSQWELSPGQFTITRPWQEHRVGDPNVSTSLLHWIIIDVGVRRPHQEWIWPDWIALAPEDIKRLTECLQQNENPVWPTNQAVTAAFRMLEQTVRKSESPTLESEVRLFTSQLLLAVLNAFENEPAIADDDLRSPRRAVRMFLDELDDHLDHQWNLGEMAKAAGMGRSQFSTYCREITNMAPVEYLTSRRVRFAGVLLVAEPRTSITEIALRSGFQSSQYFATTFRRHTGVSARAYRELNAAGLLDGPDLSRLGRTA